MTLYHVTAERSGKWWVLQADEAPGAISQVARLDQADDIKEAIAFVTGTDESEVEIEVRTVLPEEIREQMALVDQLREQSQALSALATEASRGVAGELHSVWRLTYRDVGSVLGVSHQRAHQLVQTVRDGGHTDRLRARELQAQVKAVIAAFDSAAPRDEEAPVSHARQGAIGL